MQSVKFEKPPLIEVVFGINLEMPELSLVHFGLYWKTIKDKFPTPVDTFGEFVLTEDASYSPSFPTLWFLSLDENRLIRFTESYFSYHCRCINEEYQHFEKLFQEFMSELNNLQSWWYRASKKDLKIEGYSLQYINIIDENSNWFNFKDNSKVFNIFNKDLETSLGLPKNYSSELKFDLPEDSGKIVVSLEQQNYENSETKVKDVVIFTLSAIGFQINASSLENWFCSSHDSIIQLFLDLTTEEAQSKWGRSYE